jgi:serine protease AprX
MRRMTLLLAAGLLAGVLGPLDAGAGHGAGDPAAPAVRAVPPARPAPVDAEVREAATRLAAAPGAVLDLIVSLDRPADAGLRSRLDRLGVWSRSFRHLPAAAVRLPVSRLEELRATEGVIGIYLQRRLQYFLKESAGLLNTSRAWNELGVTGKGVTVAILDTGVDFTHPDLAPAMKANVKMVEFGEPTPTHPVEGLPNSDTTSGHGTHVAGDVAARGTASNGTYRGIAPGADLVGIGVGEGISIFAVMEGFDWILANREKYGIRAVNNSWGTQFRPFDPIEPVNLATRELARAGIVVLFAAGNDGGEMTFNPYAAAPWVIPVAAGTKDGKVANFSSGGIEVDTVGQNFSRNYVEGETRRPLSMGLYHPAVTSPGENIVATRALNTITPLTAVGDDLSGIPPQQVPYYTTLSGTSMATPETAGLVALVLQAAPALDPAQVRMVLQTTARPIPGAPFYRQGYGYADATAAVELALSLRGKPAAEVQRTLEERQAARDQKVLDGLAHPARTYAWIDRAPTLAGSLTHKISVPKDSSRVKVLSNGAEGVPFVGGVNWQVTVTDASGNTVGTATSSSAITALDIDLHKLVPDPAEAQRRYARLAFGEWAVRISSVGAAVPPFDVALVDDTLAKRGVDILVAVFGPVPEVCREVTEFVPRRIVPLRFQDDAASGVPYPPNPQFTYVGPVPGGSLGQRVPERRLAGTFGAVSSTTRDVVFSGAPLTEPLTLGGAEVETWIQGPGEVAQGLLQAILLDVPPAGLPMAIGSTPEETPAQAGMAEPLQTKAPIVLGAVHTLPRGHRLAVRVAHTFVGTVAHTLLYDSDRYPSGITVTAGETVTGQNCPGQRRLDVFHRSPASLGRGPSPSPAAPAIPAPTPAPLAFRKLPEAVLPEVPLGLPL